MRGEKDGLLSALQAAQRESAELAAQLEDARGEVAAARALMPADLAAQLEEARQAAAQERRRSAVLEQAWSAAQEVGAGAGTPGARCRSSRVVPEAACVVCCALLRQFYAPSDV